MLVCLVPMFKIDSMTFLDLFFKNDIELGDSSLSKPAVSYAVLCPRNLLGAGDEIPHVAGRVMLSNLPQ